MMFNFSPKASFFDQVYRGILISKFFSQGWGDVETMKRIFSFRKILSNRKTCNQLVDRDYPIYIDKKVEETDSYILTEGHFTSPLVHYLPEIVPKESEVAKFQLLLPKKWPSSGLKPICLHLAGTGDHFFWRRRVLMAKPLLQDAGIGSIILENPFYGVRKPKQQKRSCLRWVSDLFVMGGCLILESVALFNWCERLGFGPLGVTGISMGGHMASLAGVSWPKPISLVPCLSWTTASYAFTQGVLSGSIPWKTLEEQYLAIGGQNLEELKEMIHTPEANVMFNAGKQFAQTFPAALENLPLIDSKEEMITPKDIKVDCVNFMSGIMDECTHLANFSPPVDPELVTILSASQDAYVPRDNLIPLTQLWQGSKFKLIEGGHIKAIVFNSDVFREAIIDSMRLNAMKYHQKEL